MNTLQAQLGGETARAQRYFQQLYKLHVCFVTPPTKWIIPVADWS